MVSASFWMARRASCNLRRRERLKEHKKLREHATFWSRPHCKSLISRTPSIHSPETRRHIPKCLKEDFDRVSLTQQMLYLCAINLPGRRSTRRSAFPCSVVRSAPFIMKNARQRHGTARAPSRRQQVPSLPSTLGPINAGSDHRNSASNRLDSAVQIIRSCTICSRQKCRKRRAGFAWQPWHTSFVPRTDFAWAVVSQPMKPCTKRSLCSISLRWFEVGTNQKSLFNCMLGMRRQSVASPYQAMLRKTTNYVQISLNLLQIRLCKERHSASLLVEEVTARKAKKTLSGPPIPRRKLHWKVIL